jgi:hypothetical protein
MIKEVKNLVSVTNIQKGKCLQRICVESFDKIEVDRKTIFQSLSTGGLGDISFFSY